MLLKTMNQEDMNQEEFSKIFLKHETNRRTEDKCTGAGLRYENLQSPKECRELTSPVLNYPRMAPLAGVSAKTSISNETSFFVTPYEAPALEILKAVGEVYSVKIVFDPNKLSSCLPSVNLKSEDCFTQFQTVYPLHSSFLLSGGQYGSS